MDEILNPEEYPKESFGTKELKNAAGNVEFNHVDFGYGDKNIFKDLSFNVKAGETVGIVGRSGEGKTTILNLLPRFYDVSKGNIKIDGINIQELTQESLRNTVSIVPQSPYIFNVSIRDNLLYAKPDATQDEIEDACKKAALHDFIISKPDGYDTFVGEGGVVLSGGQKQRLAIARALLKKSKILLLDEATSALDNETQQKIKKAIANIGTECTVIIVAHRLTTVEDCDKILVLSNHRIEAEGTHKQLLKKCEVYRELYTQNDDE
jgi:ATP-binding cassette subfamily B protein